MNRFSPQKLYIFMIIFFIFNLLSAQNFLFHRIPKDSIQFEFKFLQPDLKGDMELSTLSGLYDFSLNFPLGPTTYINISIPYIVMNYELSYLLFNTEYRYTDKENGIGNLYLGIQIKPEDSVENSLNMITSVGIFLPTLSENKYLLSFEGIYTDLHQFYKYIPNILTIFGNFAIHKKRSSGYIYGFELGPNMIFPTKNSGEGELYLHYGLTGGVQTPDFAIVAELLGLMIVSEDYENFGDRFSHSFIFGLQWTKSRIMPGIFYKLYLEEEQTEVVNGVFGLKVDVELANF